MEEQPVKAVNQAYSQFDNDGLFVLTLGMANPPPVMGSKAQKLKMLESIAAVTVTPVGRFAMTEAHAESMMNLLQTNLKQYRAKKRKEGK